MSNPVKIIIADDHSMIREGLKQLLELEGTIRVIGEAGDGKECLNLIEQLHPDVVLLDINMPVMSGLQVLEKLRTYDRKQKVLILTIHDEVEYLMRAIEIGVNGYVLKDSESMILKKAIMAIYQGEEFIDASLIPMMKDKMRADAAKGKNDVLTRREIEILRLVAEGLFNKEIAYKLSISEKTVKNHVSNIFKKIGVSDRTQAAVYAIKNGIVKL